MKKLAFLIICAFGALSSHQASAQSTLYVRVDGGGSFPINTMLNGLDDFSPSPMVGVGVGFKILPFLRTDVTASYRPGYNQSTTDPATGLLQKSDIKSLAAFLNGYFDIPTGTSISPYVGAGVGAARNQVGTTTVTDGVTTLSVPGATKTSFAYQAMVGLSIPIFVGVAFDAGYHFVDVGRFSTSANGNINGVPVAVAAQSGRLKAHEIQLGLRVGF
jgi:opacity protein-like surface antigen